MAAQSAALRCGLTVGISLRSQKSRIKSILIILWCAFLFTVHLTLTRTLFFSPFLFCILMIQWFSNSHNTELEMPVSNSISNFAILFSMGEMGGMWVTQTLFMGASFELPDRLPDQFVIGSLEACCTCIKGIEVL